MRAEEELQKAIKVKLELRKWGGRDILREREREREDYGTSSFFVESKKEKSKVTVFHGIAHWPTLPHPHVFSFTLAL